MTDTLVWREVYGGRPMEHYRIIQGRALVELPGNGRDITITEEYLTEL